MIIHGVQYGKQGKRKENGQLQIWFIWRLGNSTLMTKRWNFLLISVLTCSFHTTHLSKVTSFHKVVLIVCTHRYEEQVREQQSQLEKEDFSDMVAEHAAKQKVRICP